METDYFIVHFQIPGEERAEATVVHPVSSRFRSYLQNMPGVSLKYGVLLLEGPANEFFEQLEGKGFVDASVFTDSLLSEIEETREVLIT